MSCHILTLFPKGQAQTSLSLHSRSNINVVEGFHLWYVLPSLLGILFFFCVLLSCRKQPLPRDFPFIALDMFSTFKVTDFYLVVFPGHAYVATSNFGNTDVGEIPRTSISGKKFHKIKFPKSRNPGKTFSNFEKYSIKFSGFWKTKFQKLFPENEILEKTQRL